MKNIDLITERHDDVEFLQADGFDDAIIGVNYSAEKIVYSRKKSVEILMSEGMSELDAIEHFDFNVAGSYVGDKTPIWVDDTMFE